MGWFFKKSKDQSQQEPDQEKILFLLAQEAQKSRYIKLEPGDTLLTCIYKLTLQIQELERKIK